MTKEQIEHVEQQLISFIDAVLENDKTTPAEIAALPEVVMALVKVHEL